MSTQKSSGEAFFLTVTVSWPCGLALQLRGGQLEGASPNARGRVLERIVVARDGEAVDLHDGPAAHPTVGRQRPAACENEDPRSCELAHQRA